MKKDFSHYFEPDIRRLIFYRTFYKVIVALTLVLLWDRGINDGRFQVVRDGCFVAGVCFLVLAWFSYLALDGVRLPFLPKPKPEKKRHWHHDMIDFVDEHVTTLDELASDERQAVGLFSSLLSALIYLVPALGSLLF